MLICEYKARSQFFFNITIRKVVSIHFCKDKLPFFSAKTRDSVSLKLKLAVLGQHCEENTFFRHQNIFSPLDGIDGSKAVDKTLLELSAKIGEAKTKKELCQRHGF